MTTPTEGKTANRHRKQRDAARTERDSARAERDTLKEDAVNLIAQERFVATVSHDLRNPVGAIKMAVEILKRESVKREREDLIDLIERNADQAEELINHLLDAHLIKAGGKLPIEPKRCELLSILQKCKDSLPPGTRDRVELKYDPIERIWGVWDCAHLERAFQNLISNALKFGDEKTIKITATQRADITSVCFQNFGMPISEENLLRIFGSHFRARSTEVKKGWGLGLTLVKGIAKAHNGK